MKFSFFHKGKPRTFNYKPIYYDPAKEEAEERRKSLDYSHTEGHRDRIRAAFRRRLKNQPEEVDRNSQVIRFVFYVIFTVFAIYLIFFTDFINKLVSYFVR